MISADRCTAVVKRRETMDFKIVTIKINKRSWPKAPSLHVVTSCASKWRGEPGAALAAWQSPSQQNVHKFSFVGGRNFCMFAIFSVFLLQEFLEISFSILPWPITYSPGDFSPMRKGSTCSLPPLDPFRCVNFEKWSYLGCSQQNANVFNQEKEEEEKVEKRRHTVLM